MAMNKKEQAAFKELQDRVALLSAMALPPVLKPNPLEPTGGWNDVQHGWEYNSARLHSYGVEESITEVWRSGGCVYDSPELKHGRQDRGDIYATRYQALLAMYFELLEESGKLQAAVRAELLKAEVGE